MPHSTIYVAERPSTPPPAVCTHGLARLFAGSPALVDVSLALERGRRLAILGSNGAGKTTLLRILATAIRPTFGRAEVDGVDLAARPELVRPRIGYLSHAGGLYDDLTAAENLRFAGAMRGRERGELRATVPQVLARVGLAAAADDRVRGFSVGMRRRLALARLLLAGPSLVLLDEPYAGLDADAMTLVDDVLVEWRAAGATVIVATHAAERIGRDADAVARLDGGLLVELSGDGAARTASTAPGSATVAAVPRSAGS
jgi:heme exporter protein A